MKKKQARPRKRNVRDSRAFRKALADDLVAFSWTPKGLAMLERYEEMKLAGATHAEFEAWFSTEVERAETPRKAP